MDLKERNKTCSQTPHVAGRFSDVIYILICVALRHLYLRSTKCRFNSFITTERVWHPKKRPFQLMMMLSSLHIRRQFKRKEKRFSFLFHFELDQLGRSIDWTLSPAVLHMANFILQSCQPLGELDSPLRLQTLGDWEEGEGAKVHNSFQISGVSRILQYRRFNYMVVLGRGHTGM